jgi:hypothetical protein
MRNRWRVGMAVSVWAAGTWAIWAAVPVRPRAALFLPTG